MYIRMALKQMTLIETILQIHKLVYYKIGEF